MRQDRKCFWSGKRQSVHELSVYNLNNRGRSIFLFKYRKTDFYITQTNSGEKELNGIPVWNETRE